jgi:hypothetical protein
VQPLPLSHVKSGEHWITSLQLRLPVHTTSQAHDELQATPRHELGPEQLTSHGPLPHCTLRHALCPPHVILQAVAPWQLTPLRHELSVPHRMSHLYPVGQITSLAHADVWPHSIVHVLFVTLHDVHGIGQLGASIGFLASTLDASIAGTTQNPLTHCRPFLQSPDWLHA